MLKSVKRTIVRRRPRMGKRANWAARRGVIYIEEDWIGCKVVVVPYGVFNGLMWKIREIETKHKNIRKIIGGK